MAELKAYRSANRPLQRQLDELLIFVKDCENRLHATFWMEGAGDPVKICRVADSGSEVAFAILGPGDVFGEIGVLEEDGTRSADAQALATTECLVIDRRIVVDFLKSHPEAMWRIVTTLSAYVRA